MALGIIVSSNIRVDTAGMEGYFKLKNATLIRSIEGATIRILKKNAPVYTGRLRQSIKPIESARRQTSGVFQGFVTIGPTVSYSIFTIKKVRPSIGRYVRAIRARIKTGVHPGSKSNRFIFESRAEIQQSMTQIFDSIYGPGRINVRKYIR